MLDRKVIRTVCHEALALLDGFRDIVLGKGREVVVELVFPMQKSQCSAVFRFLSVWPDSSELLGEVPCDG